MPNTFTIEGTLKNAKNVAIANKYIKFRIMSVGTDTEDDVTYPKETVEFQTDTNGDFTGTLWVNGDSGVDCVYEIKLPNKGQRVQVIIPSAVAGSTVRLEDIIESYQVTASTQQSSVLDAANTYTNSLAANPSTNGNFSATEWRTDLGLVIGTDVQAYDAGLADLAGLTPTNESIIKGDGTNWVAATNFRVDAGTAGTGTEIGTGTANGALSVAEGDNTTASGLASHVEGTFSEASGDDSHAEGNGTTAGGTASHSEGNGTTAGGDYSHTEGNGTTSSGTASHAEGSGTAANGDASHAEGSTTMASGSASHAEGAQTTASAQTAHAEGLLTIASGNDSHAEGSNTIASGSQSHSEGNFTTASGDYSHAEGFSTTASGDYSSATGRRAKAIHDGARVEADSQNADVSSTTTDQYTARFQNGYEFKGGRAAFEGDIETTDIEAEGSAGLTLANSAGTTVLTVGAGVGTGVTAAGGVNITGNLAVTGDTVIATETPASASATGTAGQIAWDASYIYICTATDTWKRVAITTW